MSVENFTVSLDGIGKVEWEGKVDVTYINLDSEIFITKMYIQVYPAGGKEPAPDKGKNTRKDFLKLLGKCKLTEFES